MKAAAMADQYQSRSGLIEPDREALAQHSFCLGIKTFARLIKHKPRFVGQQRTGQR